MRPILLEFMGLSIYSYPLFMGIAWGVAYQLSRALLVNKTGTSKNFSFLFWGSFLFSWLGAKLFFLIYSGGEEYFNYVGSSNFWLGGGFVFYGGLIFGSAFIFAYTVLFKRFESKSLYLFLPALCFGHAIGRLGCFFAGCCFGHETEFSISILMHNVYRHPVQLYESLILGMMGVVILILMRKNILPKFIVSFYFIGYAIARFMLEFLRGDVIRGVHAGGLSTSQYVSVAILCTVLLFFIIDRFRRT